MMSPEEPATGLFRILETGDAALARRIVAPDNVNREVAVSPAACRIPGASSAWMHSAFTDLRFPPAHRHLSPGIPGPLPPQHRDREPMTTTRVSGDAGTQPHNGCSRLEQTHSQAADRALQRPHMPN